MLIVLLYLSIISVETLIFMVQKKNQLGKYLFYQSKCNLTATNSLLSVRLKWHGFQPVSFTVLYS